MFDKLIGGYYPIDSFVHRIHPTCKLLCFFCFLGMCFFSTSLEAGLVICMFLSILLLLSDVPLQSYFKVIYRMRFLFVFMIVLTFFTGDSFFRLFLSIMQIIWIIEYSGMLYYTTKPLDVMAGVESIFSFLTYFHLPIHQFAFAISLAFQFVPLLFLQGNKILASQASRGLDYHELSFWKKIVVIQSLILPMFVLSMKRADELAEVMEVRLYCISQKHTTYGVY